MLPLQIERPCSPAGRAMPGSLSSRRRCLGARYPRAAGRRRGQHELGAHFLVAAADDSKKLDRADVSTAVLVADL